MYWDDDEELVCSFCYAITDRVELVFDSFQMPYDVCLPCLANQAIQCEICALYFTEDCFGDSAHSICQFCSDYREYLDESDSGCEYSSSECSDTDCDSD